MPVRPHYLHTGSIHGHTLSTGEFILGVTGFGAARPPMLSQDIPFATVGMSLLQAGPCHEVWVTNEPPTWRVQNGIRFALAGDALFGMLEMDPCDERGMEAQAFDAYARIFALAEATGCPHLIRVFNYFARITGHENGTERYRHFNVGRQAAFRSFRRSTEAAPAASCLGAASGGLLLYFIAASESGIPLENPRQVSAYRYPASYGPISPSFSRAMIARQHEATDLYISGTASIVGHHSMHAGNAAAQTRETLRNLDALLGQYDSSTLPDVAHASHLKIYVRHKHDAPVIIKVLAKLPPFAGTMVMNAEICRKDLLVEIEAFCHLVVRS